MKKIILLMLFATLGWQQAQAQCPGTSIDFKWLLGATETTYTYAYDGVRNGKCAYIQLTPGTSIEWTGSQWNIYGNNQYFGSAFFHSTVDVGDRPSNNLADWVSDFNIAMISLSGTGTVDHSSVAAPTAYAQTFCNSATVADLVVSGASGSTFNWYESYSGGSALPTTTALATGTYYVSQTLNGRESARTSVEVTLTTTNKIITASPQYFFGVGTTVASLYPNGTTIKWYTASTGGSALTTTTALVTGTYYVSGSKNSCESERTAVAVIVNTTPAPTASAQTFCNAATVADLVVSGDSNDSTFNWYEFYSGDAALPITTALATGTYYVSQTINGMESPRTSVEVTVNKESGRFSTGSLQIFCSGATVANLYATGTSINWYTASTGGSALVTTTALVTGTYYVSNTVNSCESDRTAVSVIVNTTPAPTASAQTVCNGAKVSSLTATGINKKWYTESTGGSALATSTALVTGTYYVSQTINSCESFRTAVAVTDNTTLAPTASAQTVCNGATVASLSATGTSLKWYAESTGGSALATSAVVVTGTYYVSQNLNFCESSRTAVAVTVNTTLAPTASAQTFCSGATVANLVASPGVLARLVPVTYKWYTASTGGTSLATSTALATGTYYVSNTLNGCESLRTAVSVTINTTPAPTASAQTFCSGATVANLVATGTSLKWYAASTGGSALTTAALATRTYYVSQTLNSCESDRTLVAVTVNTTSAPTASAQTFYNAATVASLAAMGTSLKWYTASTGGTSLITSTVIATGTYYVSQTINGCESDRTAVAITVNAIPSTMIFCAGSNIATAIGTSTYKFYASKTGGSVLASTLSLITKTYFVTQLVNGIESTPRVAVAVTINAIPANLTNITASDAFLCKYIGTTNTVTYTTIPGGNSYIWTVPAGVSIIDGQGTNVLTVDFHSATTSGADTIGNITVNTVNASGCAAARARTIELSTTLPSAPAKVELTYNGVVQVRVGGFVGDSTKTLVLEATDISNTANKYSWELPAGVSVVSGNPATDKTIAIHLGGVTAGNTDLVFKAYAFGGCGTSTAKSLVVTRTAPAAPTTLALTNDAIATTTKITNVSAYTGKLNATPLTLTATPNTTYGAEATSYKWILPSGINIVDASAAFVSENSKFKTYTSSSNVIKINLSGVGTATSLVLKVYGVNGNGESLLSRDLTLTSAIPAKPGTLTTSAGSTATYHPTCGTITVKVPSVFGVTYNWSVKDGAVANVLSTNSDGNEATIAISKLPSVVNSSFKIGVVASNGTGSSETVYTIKLGTACSTTKSKADDIKTAKVTNEFNVIAFPNPSSNVFNIKIESLENTKTELSVYDSIGRLIEQLQVQTNEVELGSRYPTGVYNLIVKQGKNVKTVRVVKQ